MFNRRLTIRALSVSYYSTTRTHERNRLRLRNVTSAIFRRTIILHLFARFRRDNSSSVEIRVCIFVAFRRSPNIGPNVRCTSGSSHGETRAGGASRSLAEIAISRRPQTTATKHASRPVPSGNTASCSRVQNEPFVRRRRFPSTASGTDVNGREIPFGTRGIAFVGIVEGPRPGPGRRRDRESAPSPSRDERLPVAYPYAADRRSGCTDEIEMYVRSRSSCVRACIIHTYTLRVIYRHDIKVSTEPINYYCGCPHENKTV